MNKKSDTSKASAEKLVKNSCRKTACQYGGGEKIRIILTGLLGKESIAKTSA